MRVTRVAVQRLLVLVLSLFMLLVSPAVAHSLDLVPAAPTASLLQSPANPTDPAQDQDDEVSAIVLAASPELPIPAGDDDGAGGDGFNVTAPANHDDFTPATPEARTYHANGHVTVAYRPWSTGPPQA